MKTDLEEGEDRPTGPMFDIDITRINDLMFNLYNLFEFFRGKPF